MIVSVNNAPPCRESIILKEKAMEVFASKLPIPIISQSQLGMFWLFPMDKPSHFETEGLLFSKCVLQITANC